MLKDWGIYLIAIVVGILLTMAVTVKLAMWLAAFWRELQYINGEIRRCDDDERWYWINQKRRLWLSVLPFVSYEE